MRYSLPSTAIRHNATMYTPAKFRISEHARLHALMQDYPFAVMVTAGAEGLDFTHLPLMVAPERGPHGSLLGHMARANPHWRRFDGEQEATAIFTGPHAYVSPSWYASPRTVPTWNYAVVHAYGNPRVIEDEVRARGVLDRLVAEHEAPLEQRWTIDQAEPGVDRQLDHIVVFELEITRLEGAFKLNQNRSREDRQGVVDALSGNGDPLQRAVASAMRRALADDKSGA